MPEGNVKEKVQNVKGKIQRNLKLVKRGNFMEQRDKILGEEKPEVFPKLRNKVEDWKPGQNVGGGGGTSVTTDRKRIRRPSEAPNSREAEEKRTKKGQDIDPGYTLH